MYADLDDLKARLSEDKLIDLASETEELDAAALAVIDQCITDADSEIDSYLRQSYTLPLSETPNLINQLSCEIAIVNLYKKRDVFSDDTKDRYAWCKDKLKGLAAGSVDLGIDDDDDTPQKIIIESNTLRGW